MQVQNIEDNLVPQRELNETQYEGSMLHNPFQSYVYSHVNKKTLPTQFHVPYWISPEILLEKPHERREIHGAG